MQAMTKSMSLTRRVAQWVTRESGPLPDTVRNEAVKAFVDTVGCALAGWFEPPPQKLVAAHALGRPSDGDHAGSLWGRDRRVPGPMAALVNGTAAHALDYDDLVLEVTAHPSGSLVAAALAAGESQRASGEAVVRAYVRGLEILVRVGEALGFQHYQLGWHATSTLGVLGASCTSGYLLGLDAKEMVHALGVATSMASGLRKNFGSMVKPLHMGLAARDGLMAARLAAGGFEADRDAFGPNGFARAFTGGARTRIESLPLGGPLYLEESGLSRKKYPCCYATHRLIEGALRLREQGLTDPAALERLTVTVPPGGLAPLQSDSPTTGAEARFSGEYCVAGTLLDGTVTLESFTSSRVERESVRDLMDRITLHEAPGEPPDDATLGDGVVSLEAALRDGRTLASDVEAVPGSPRDPLGEKDLRDKFRQCLEAYRRRSQGTPAEDGIDRFEDWMGLGTVSDLRTFLNDVRAGGAGIARKNPRSTDE